LNCAFRRREKNREDEVRRKTKEKQKFPQLCLPSSSSSSFSFFLSIIINQSLERGCIIGSLEGSLIIDQ